MGSRERRDVIVCVAECRNLLRSALRAMLRPDEDAGAVVRALWGIEERCRETREGIVSKREENLA